MAGFLDKRDRIVDMTLTDYGRQLISVGQLDFVYWAAFDDGVDYSPVLMESSSLDSITLSSSLVSAIEESLVIEAIPGRTNVVNGNESAGLTSILFDVPQGKVTIPRAMLPMKGAIDVIQTSQRKLTQTHVKKTDEGVVVERVGPIDVGYERLNATSLPVSLGYKIGDYPLGHEYSGFFIEIHVSGTDGLTSVDARRDSTNSLVFNGDLVYLGEV